MFVILLILVTSKILMTLVILLILMVIFQLENKRTSKSGKLQQQSTNFGFKELVSNLPMLCTE